LICIGNVDFAGRAMTYDHQSDMVGSADKLTISRGAPKIGDLLERHPKKVGVAAWLTEKQFSNNLGRTKRGRSRQQMFLRRGRISSNYQNDSGFRRMVFIPHYRNILLWHGRFGGMFA